MKSVKLIKSTIVSKPDWGRWLGLKGMDLLNHQWEVINKNSIIPIKKIEEEDTND